MLDEPRAASHARLRYLRQQGSQQCLGQLLCLDASGKDRRPRLMKCHELRGGQEWKFRDDQALTAIYNMAAGLCLTVDGRRAGSRVEMDVCSMDDSHMWELLSNEDDKEL